MFSGLAVVAAGLGQLHPATALYAAAAFNAIGVVLNSFPDLPKKDS